MTLVFYGIGRYLMTGMVVHGNDWLSFRQCLFYKYTTEAGVTALRQGRVMSQIIFTVFVATTTRSVQLGLTYTINTGKTKNFENICWDISRRYADRGFSSEYHSWWARLGCYPRLGW